MPYATVTDYQVRHPGALSAEESDRITAYLSDVSAVITARLKGQTPDADVARMVAIAAVHRIVNNPGNVRSSQAGGMSITYAVVGRYITDEEWDMLLSSPAAAEAYTVSVYDREFAGCRTWEYPRQPGWRDNMTGPA